MTLPAFPRGSQYLFHHWTEIRGLLMQFGHKLVRCLHRDSQLYLGHFLFYPRVYVFCVIHNLTDGIHNGTLHPAG
jgi:hypothetical protein